MVLWFFFRIISLRVISLDTRYCEQVPDIIKFILESTILSKILHQRESYTTIHSNPHTEELGKLDKWKVL